MKTIKRISLIFAVVLALALLIPGSVSAAPADDGRTVFGETYILEDGRILNGDLAVIGGVVDIREGATVNGDVFVLGGLVTIDGTVEGNLAAIGGTVNLESNAVIQGNLFSPGSFVNRANGAVIMGDEINTWNLPGTNIDIPRIQQPLPSRTIGSRVLSMITSIGREIAFLFLITGLGALLLLILPKSAERMTGALNAEPWTMLGFGALSAFVMLVGGVILSITICLIPVVILVALTFGLAWLVGWLTLGYELGKRIAAGIFKKEWHPVLTAAVGNFVLYIIARSLDLIPCIGGFMVLVVGLFGLGMAVVTLFGTQPYPREINEVPEKQVVLFEEASESEPPSGQA